MRPLVQKLLSKLRFANLKGINLALEVVNSLKQDGVIEDYAIGGSIGAMAYLETFLTKDVDIFIPGPLSESTIVDLSSIWSHLMRMAGTTWDGQFLVVGGWKLDFLPVSSSLEKEALSTAVVESLSGIDIKVFRPEYLCAIMLEVGRDQDTSRLTKFVHQSAVDINLLEQLVEKFGLEVKWASYKQTHKDEFNSKV